MIVTFINKKIIKGFDTLKKARETLIQKEKIHTEISIAQEHEPTNRIVLEFVKIREV